MALKTISRARVAQMESRRPDTLLIGVTGTPGVGKSYFSKRLSNRLSSAGIAARVIEINDIVDSTKAYSGVDELGSRIVKLGMLRRSMKKAVKSSAISIVVGHLLPETGLRPDICIVLRQDLGILKKRLEKRHYAKAKIRENLLAEAYDDIGTRMAKKCGQMYEAETGKEREYLMRYIVEVALGKRPKRPKSRNIDKFAELEKLILNGNRLRF
ncbi:MAG: AAA family ATPase [Methanothrix sp.]